MKYRSVLFLSLIALGGPCFAQTEEDFDPLGIAVEDAINCVLTPQEYNGFALTLSSEEQGYKARGWTKQDSGNPFLSQYELPEPIAIAGHPTRTIVFSSIGVLAVLDVAETQGLAEEEGIENVFGASTKFLGERTISSSVEEDAKLGMRFVATVKRAVSNVTSHPGKTLVGCSYSIDMEPMEEESLME